MPLSPRPAPTGRPLPPQVVATHCATVVLLGDRAYKLKKPVDLGFLDFTTVAAREVACRRELALNRRFAADVYLGLARVSDETGETCDWMVVMRRMPAERRLSTLVRAGAPVAEALRDLARDLATHHAGALRSEQTDAAGRPEAVRRRWTATLTELARFPGLVGAGELAEISRLALGFLAGRAPLLQRVVEQGHVRDGHGDLLADDVFCLPQGPRALDCLEFDDELRYVDGLDDAACLAMDLERLGAEELGEAFLTWYLEFSGRPRLEALVQHYLAYRAGVRLKVAALRWEQGEPSAVEDVRTLTALTLRHLRLALPRLVLVGGSPGTGKSTVAGALADGLGAVVLRSDRIRKESAGLDPAARTSHEWQTGLYDRAVTARTYRLLTVRAGELLGLGESVVLDACFASEDRRAAAREVARSASAALVELRCVAPADVVEQRILARAGTGDPSDATPALARAVDRQFAPWPQAQVLDTTTAHDPAELADLVRAQPGTG